MTTQTLVAGQDNTDAGSQQTADGTADGEGTQNPQTPDGQQAAGEGAKPAGEGTKPADGEQKADEIVYEFKSPEGVELDQGDLEKFTAIAKELKLPADKAQALVDLAAQREIARVEAHVQKVTAWAEEVKADKEIGGDKLPETLSVARKALDLGPPELKELLNTTGLGNHPAVVKWAHAVGKALSEDRFVQGGLGAQQKGSREDRLYPSTAKA